jgi:hypothetical protein
MAREEFTAQQTWRIFRIMAEFVDGFDELAGIGPAVSVFGSARLKPDHPHYRQAVEVGRHLVKHGFAVITGGGPGVMEAANKGAMEAGGVSVGLNIELPQEQKPNPYQTISLSYRYFFARKVMFVKHAVGYICFPGGFGTADEFFEAMTLIQTHKTAKFPVMCIGTDYWGGLFDWMRTVMLDRSGAISPEDLRLFHVTDDVEHAVDFIKKNHDEYAFVQAYGGRPLGEPDC